MRLHKTRTAVANQVDTKPTIPLSRGKFNNGPRELLSIGLENADYDVSPQSHKSLGDRHRVTTTMLVDESDDEFRMECGT